MHPSQEVTTITVSLRKHNVRSMRYEESSFFPLISLLNSYERIDLKMNEYSFKGGNISKIVFAILLKRGLKEKTLVLRGANSFLLE